MVPKCGSDAAAGSASYLCVTNLACGEAEWRHATMRLSLFTMMTWQEFLEAGGCSLLFTENLCKACIACICGFSAEFTNAVTKAAGGHDLSSPCYVR